MNRLILARIVVGWLAIFSDSNALLASESVDELRSLLAQLVSAASTSSDTRLLRSVLQIAELNQQRIQRDVKDYTCVVVRRERLEGALGAPETLFAKLRHEGVCRDGQSSQFSVYMRFEAPARVKGREILFSTVEPDPHLLVHVGGGRLGFLTLRVAPDSPIAMNGNRYPITEFGLARLMERVLDFGERALTEEDNCTIRAKADCDVEGRSCTQIEVCHPQPRAHLVYHLARIYIDDQLLLPTRFQSYDWPRDGSEEPILLEEYTYRDVRTNVDLTDADFDRYNPSYGFSK